MTTHALTHQKQPKRPAHTAIRIPSRKLEYVFYLVMFYSLTAEIWGVSVPLLAGGLLLGMSAICILQLRAYAKKLYAPIGSLIACAITFVLIQIVIHDASIKDGLIRVFVISTLQLMLVYSLCLRPGFCHRYPIFLFIIALATLPFLTFSSSEVERARVSADLGVSGGLSHPNSFGEWFGYCAIYFVIRGLETKRFTQRVGAWVTAVGCLLVITLTVGRGALFGTALAITVALRGLFKRGFVPVLLLIILAGVVYESGLLDQAVSHYAARGMEETGRELLWPAAINRIFSSPFVTLFGGGPSNVTVDIAGHAESIGPHNTFLLFALSSGVIPLAFFIAFWIQAVWKAATHEKLQEGDSFRIPYLIFTFVVAMLGDLGFMSPWGALALSVGAGSVLVYGEQRFVVVHVGGKVKYGLLSVAKRPPQIP